MPPTVAGSSNALSFWSLGLRNNSCYTCLPFISGIPDASDHDRWQTCDRSNIFVAQQHSFSEPRLTLVITKMLWKDRQWHQPSTLCSALNRAYSHGFNPFESRETALSVLGQTKRGPRDPLSSVPTLQIGTQDFGQRNHLDLVLKTASCCILTKRSHSGRWIS